MELKTCLAIIFLICFNCFSCSGPTEKPPQNISDKGLPEVADSVSDKPKDGVIVPVDTTSQPEINGIKTAK